MFEVPGRLTACDVLARLFGRFSLALGGVLLPVSYVLFQAALVGRGGGIRLAPTLSLAGVVLSLAGISLVRKLTRVPPSCWAALVLNSLAGLLSLMLA